MKIKNTQRNDFTNIKLKNSMQLLYCIKKKVEEAKTVIY